MTEFTAAEKLHAARREVIYRERVYARFVDQGKMRPEAAERELALMKAIQADYERLAAEDKGPLFGERA